jgi:hypothetical protein
MVVLYRERRKNDFEKLEKPYGGKLDPTRVYFYTGMNKMFIRMQKSDLANKRAWEKFLEKDRLREQKQTKDVVCEVI